MKNSYALSLKSCTKALAGIAITSALMGLPNAAMAQETGQSGPSGPSGDLIVTLLGTGTPSADPNRFGYSNLVQAGDVTLLFDAGRSSVVRLNQMGIPVGDIDGVFFTHFHSDHTNGLADIFMTGYLTGPIGGRDGPLHIYGPEGVAQLAEGIKMAHLSDAVIRIDDEGVSEVATDIEAHEAEPGVVFKQDGVAVTMFKTFHGDAIDPTVGYRVDYNGKSVAFSGDVASGEGLIEHARGVDMLVHSVGTAPQEMLELPFVKRVLSHHISPQEAGSTFEATQPGIAVYSHVVRLGDGKVKMSDIVEMTRKTYAGPIAVGEDLMQFRISDNGLAILNAGQ